MKVKSGKPIRENALNIPLTAQEKERIKVQADKAGMTMATFARFILNNYLNQEECRNESAN